MGGGEGERVGGEEEGAGGCDKRKRRGGEAAGENKDCMLLKIHSTTIKQ